MRIAHPDNAGKKPIRLLCREVIENLLSGMVLLKRYDVEQCVHNIPVAECRAVTVPGTDLFPGVRERKTLGLDALLVQFCDIPQHRAPFRFPQRFCMCFQRIHHYQSLVIDNHKAGILIDV